MNPLHSSRGAAPVKTALLVIVAAVVCFVGIRMLEPVYDNVMLKRTMNQWAKWHVLSGSVDTSELRAHIQDAIDEHDIPLDQGDVRVEFDRGTGVLTVNADYEVFVELPGYVHTYRFTPEVEVSEGRR